MTPPNFGVILIGDELLTGKRCDKHMPKVIELLHARGLELAWAVTTGDDAGRLQAILQWSLASHDIVFSFGGIGATPDDRTRQCAAAAAAVALEINDEGRAELEAAFGEQTYPQRIHMVEWPAGSRMIPNPVNRVPGFSFGQHHFVPGFPIMAWPMVEWVLDNHYPHLRVAEPPCEYLLEALNTPESELIDVMDEIMAAYPSVRLSCLPNGSGVRSIEFGVRGAPRRAAAAYFMLLSKLRLRNVTVVETLPPPD